MYIILDIQTYICYVSFMILNPLNIIPITKARSQLGNLAEIKNAKVNDLRHTFVAHHLKHGVSLTIISRVLGHKRISTTERYLEYAQERAKENTILTEL